MTPCLTPDQTPYDPLLTPYDPLFDPRSDLTSVLTSSPVWSHFITTGLAHSVAIAYFRPGKHDPIGKSGLSLESALTTPHGHLLCNRVAHLACRVPGSAETARGGFQRRIMTLLGSRCAPAGKGHAGPADAPRRRAQSLRSCRRATVFAGLSSRVMCAFVTSHACAAEVDPEPLPSLSPAQECSPLRCHPPL